MDWLEIAGLPPVVPESSPPVALKTPPRPDPRGWVLTYHSSTYCVLVRTQQSISQCDLGTLILVSGLQP